MSEHPLDRIADHEAAAQRDSLGEEIGYLDGL